MKGLFLSYNKIKHFKLIGHYPNLLRLKLMHNELEYFIQDNLSTELFANLELLDISFNQIKDITFLRQFKQLNSIILINNQIETIDSLFNLTKIRVLVLDSNIINETNNLLISNNMISLSIENNNLKEWCLIIIYII